LDGSVVKEQFLACILCDGGLSAKAILSLRVALRRKKRIAEQARSGPMPGDHQDSHRRFKFATVEMVAVFADSDHAAHNVVLGLAHVR
jgi:hypothetical protein